jgi:hypothetical protein
MGGRLGSGVGGPLVAGNSAGEEEEVKMGGGCMSSQGVNGFSSEVGMWVRTTATGEKREGAEGEGNTRGGELTKGAEGRNAAGACGVRACF